VKKVLLTMLLVTAMVMASVGMAAAESILFPYVVYNTSAGLDTMVTVVNVSANTQMHLRYVMKNATATNANTSSCTENDFYRATTQNDIVTFAVGGSSTLNSGNAMFDDPTNYSSVGVGAPNFKTNFADTVTAGVGYLMVTPAAAGADVAAANANTLAQLDGEASIYDIASGAMWGYKAIPSINGSNVNFSTATTQVNTTNAAIANVVTYPAPVVTAYPPANFTGRLFVTPLSATQDATWNASVATGLYYQASTLGAFDRNEQTLSGGLTQTSICVGRVNISDMHPLAFNSSTGAMRTTGGWAYLGLTGGTVNQAAIYELKYGAHSGQSLVVNDAKQVVGRDIR
jgi:hypothetical protein